MNNVGSKHIAPSPQGYFYSGTIIQVWEYVSRQKLGDREAWVGAGIANRAEFIIVPHNLGTRIPDNESLQSASSTNIDAIVLHGIRRLKLKLRKKTSFIGLRLHGHISLQLQEAANIRASGIDLNPDRGKKLLHKDWSFGFL